MGSVERRRLVARWLGLGATVSMWMAPASALADETRFFGGGGAFVGVRFGSDHVNVGWGLEALLSVVPNSGICSSRARSGGGPTLQFSMEGIERPLLVVGGHGGGEVLFSGSVVESVAITGELGLAMRFAPELDFGLHLGLVNSALYSHVLFRAAIGADDYTFGAGPRLIYPGEDALSPTTFGVGNCYVDGRPLRVDGERVPLVEPGGLGERGQAWARDAQTELASVPAFLQLAADLLAVGAPDALVARALDAAEDEIRHAALCWELVRREAPEAAVTPSVPAVPLDQGGDRWRRLVVESWLDGCLGEGAAAERAVMAAELTTDPIVRRTQHTIAGDESRHAELAWHVLAWARTQPEGRALADALTLPAPSPEPDLLDDPAGGFLGPRRALEVERRTAQVAHDRLLALA